MIGQTVGTYKILGKIGEGGMGAVYKGLDLMLEREVAIKVLRPELAQDAQVVERFRSEAVTLARLNHLRVATLFSFFREGDNLFMVMEFVPGQTLNEVIEQRGSMTLAKALPLFCQALDGIGHAHHLGIVHRDIKPANIMVTPEGDVKVMDFGIARVLGTARATRTGRLIGTLEYMAPEQVRGAGGDARSDIYALGILLYELLTGRVPFDHDSDYELMRAHLETAPPPPRALKADLPASIERVLLRALEKEADHRFQSAEAFRDALLDCLAEQEEQTASVSSPAAAPADDSFAPKATRVASQEERQEASAPKHTRAASSAERDATGLPPQTRMAAGRPTTLAVADHAAATPRAEFPGILGGLGTKQYAGLAGVVLVLLFALAAWPSSSTPSEERLTENVAEEAVQEAPGTPVEASTSPQNPRPFEPREARVTPPPAAPVTGRPAPGMTAQRGESIQDWLAKAQQHFDADELTTPEGENALAYCQRVLNLAPGNTKALALIEQIAERYESWGDASKARGAYDEAASHYQTSLSIVGENSRVTAKLADLGQPAPQRKAAAPTTPAAPATPAASTTSRARRMTLPAGAQVKVRLAEPVAPVNGAEKGDEVAFTVTHDVVIGGQVLIRKNTTAYGTITLVRRAKSVRRGEVRFNITSVRSVDGQRIQLQSGDLGMKAGRGKEAFVQAGERYEATVSSAVSVAVS